MIWSRRRLLLSMAAISGSPRFSAAQAPAGITIAMSSGSLGAAVPRIARELGLFEKRGIDAKLIIMDNGAAAIAALISGSAQFAYGGPGEVIAARARNQRLVAIANGYAGPAGTLVLAKPVADKLGIAVDAPVAQRLRALDNLVIASPSATSAYTVSIRIAAASQDAKVRFTHMAQPAMIAALESGAVQGFIAGAPFWAAPVLRGSAVSWISGPQGDLPPAASPASSVSLQTLDDYAQRNRDLMDRVKGVFADFSTAIVERPQVVKAAVGRLYPDLDAATLDILFTSESRGWNASPLNAADFAREIAFLKAGGSQIPDLDRIDPATMVFR